MINLYPHQIRALEQTKDQNRVAIKGYEGLYEIDRQGLEWCTQSENIKHSVNLGHYKCNFPNVKRGDANVEN